MTRPNKADVDEALKLASEYPESWLSHTLASEVRALREELGALRRASTPFADGSLSTMSCARCGRECYDVRHFDEPVCILRVQSELEAQIKQQNIRIAELQHAKRVMSENEGRLHAQLAYEQTKLARVQALPAKWRDCEGEHCSRCASELDAALRES